MKSPSLSHLASLPYEQVKSQYAEQVMICSGFTPDEAREVKHKIEALQKTPALASV